jgi:hypothetical protein
MKLTFIAAWIFAASVGFADTCNNQKSTDNLGTIVCYGIVKIDPPTLSSEDPPWPLKVCYGSDATIGKMILTDRRVYRNLGEAFENCRSGEQVVAYYQYRKDRQPTIFFRGYTFVPVVQNHQQ